MITLFPSRYESHIFFNFLLEAATEDNDSIRCNYTFRINDAADKYRTVVLLDYYKQK